MCSNLVWQKTAKETNYGHKKEYCFSVADLGICTGCVFSGRSSCVWDMQQHSYEEEMKREIRAQVADALANGESLNCNSTETTNNIYEAIENLGQEINNNLEAIAKKLISLHQPGMIASHPATSCQEIYNLNPIAPSGYYWLQSTNDSAVHVYMYCDMTLTCKGVGGGWMQVAKLDMINSSHQCPPGTRLRTDDAKRLYGIGINGTGCSSTTFTLQGIEYSRVCGKIIGYQYASPDSFRDIHRSGNTINDDYVDGISLTYGSPRMHIWTFAGALDEYYNHEFFSCPCTNIHRAGSQPPSFVGNDYFCDTGSTHHWEGRLYPEDPLWDGAGCGSANTCCSLNNPPWFLKQLSSTTTDNIEMRICRDEPSTNEATPVEIIELFIQ